MPQGHDAWKWLHRAVRGDRVPENMRSQYDDESIYGPGSTNIRSMQAANDLWHHIHHDRRRLSRVRDAWMTALTRRNWFDIEPYTRHRYGVWVWESQLLVWAAGVRLRDAELRDAAAASLNTCHVLLALSAGWEAYTPKRDRRQRGYRTTFTGARSWVGDRPTSRGPYKDDRGRWFRPHTLDYTPMDNVLWWILGKGKATGERADVVAAVLGVSDPRQSVAVVGPGPLLEDLAAGPNRRDAHLAAVRRLPELFAGRILPKVPCVVVRTDRAVAFLVEKGINSGSTHFRYGQVWSSKPFSFDGDYAHWDRDRRQAWLVVDPPPRQNGKNGKGELILEGDRATIRCQRNDGTAWHPVRGQQPGWNEIGVPGRVYSVVRFGPRGLEFIIGEPDQPPPPEPEPPDDPTPPPDKDRCDSWPFFLRWLCKLFD